VPAADRRLQLAVERGLAEDRHGEDLAVDRDAPTRERGAHHRRELAVVLRAAPAEHRREDGIGHPRLAPLARETGEREAAAGPLAPHDEGDVEAHGLVEEREQLAVEGVCGRQVVRQRDDVADAPQRARRGHPYEGYRWPGPLSILLQAALASPIRCRRWAGG
jgi:hypothetical protein